jgi:hypothetical protein
LGLPDVPVQEALLGNSVMSSVETNLFPITNPGDLKSHYTLYRIRGLAADQDEFDQNIQILIGKLSRLLRSPVTVVNVDGEPYLALPDGAKELPQPYPLVRATAYFAKTAETLTLDYANPTFETAPICQRFLQFAIEGALFNHPRFWQPSAGHAFFERQPALEKDGINIYRGFAVRTVQNSDGRLCVCVDLTYKYVGRHPIPAYVSRDEFRRYRRTRCVYHFGLGWYEIQLHDHSGLNVKEQLIENEPLYDYIMRNARKPLPHEVVQLPPDSAAVRYLTARAEPRHAAAALCYPVFDTNDRRVQRLHREIIVPPHRRRSLTHSFVKSFLREIRADTMVVRVAPTPVTAPKMVFLAPDLAFGNGTILSVRGTVGAAYVGLDQLGQERLSALYHPEIGPYARKPLDQQYLVMPQSVADSYGPAFVDDLKAEVMALFPQEVPYDPHIITYDDRAARTFAAQGRAILDAIAEAAPEPGYGIVMIHEIQRRPRQRDQLAAMLMQRLRQRELYVSVIHSTVGMQSYGLVQVGNDRPRYRPLYERRGRLKGYLRNVAINKVLLLTNERWPFVLATPLNADLTIAIDVQDNTACFTFLGKSGDEIRTEVSTSREREKLSRAHVKKILLDVLRQELLLGMRSIRHVVIQRDGRIYASEVNGIRDAIETLKKECQLTADAAATFVEIHKTSAVPFRLFDVEMRSDTSEWTRNPNVGIYYILNDRDGYICSTGREFSRPGTSKPLHIRYVSGEMPFRRVLEDIYAQSCLAFTRPEDCSRLPFTLKLTDIRLAEHAGGYDEDALAFSDDEDENPAANDEGGVDE